MTTKLLPATLMIRARGSEPEVVITTPTTDYMGDVIDPAGMDTTRYMAGTRAIFLAHDYGKLPVAQTLGLTKSPQGIRARFRWLEGNPEAATVRRVFDEGVLGASVGFISIESEPAARGYRYTKSILTEWSLTGNPANPECVRMMKSLGLGHGDEIDLDAIPAEDEIDLSTLSRADVLGALREAITEQAKAATATAIARARPSLMLPDDEIDLDNIPYRDDEQDVLAGWRPDDVKAALRAGIHAAAEAGVRRALALARGRID